MSDNISTSDVIISGGGMVGMTLALALGRAGLEVAVLDRQMPDLTLDPAFDGRASAIAFAGVRLFQGIGLWPYLENHAEPITDIRVSDKDSLLYLHFDHEDLGQGPLGMMLENRHLRLGLAQAAAATPQVRIHAPDEIATLDRGSSGVTAHLKSGRILKAPLIVAAEGRQSTIRDAAGIRIHQWSYSQAGIVATIHHEQPHRGIAHERFLPAGPFAILPLNGNRSSIVWTEPTATARTIMGLNKRGFDAEMAKRFGSFLGATHSEGPRWSYPLSAHLAERFTDRRLAVIGDAAHGIHPIAGQGLNLGLKDVAALAEILVDAARLGRDLGSDDLMAEYARWRRFDAVVLTAVTDSLNRLFSNDFAPLRLARSLGLGAVHRMPRAKRLFMSHARGTLGKLPRLLAGEAL